jgi:hypothetical protein
MNNSFALALKEDRSLRYGEGSIFARKIHGDFRDELICCKGVSPMRDVGRCAGVGQPIVQLMNFFIVLSGGRHILVIADYIDQTIFCYMIRNVFVVD